jgi:hypothetical protein
LPLADCGIESTSCFNALSRNPLIRGAETPGAFSDHRFVITIEWDKVFKESIIQRVQNTAWDIFTCLPILDSFFSL